MIKIEKVNLTKENLIKIMDIDSLFYKEDILTIEWYLERYNKNHYGYLLIDGDKCVGYLVSVPVKRELYKAIVNGVMVNDLYINPQMILENSKYNYIVSSVILDEYRNKGYGQKMLEKLFNENNGKYCSLTITKAGYNLSKKYMRHEKELNDEVHVFTYNNKSLW